MLAFRFHRDADGRPRVERTAAVPYGKTLDHFLETDLLDLAYCDRLVSETASLPTRPNGHWNASGNAFGLDVDAVRAVITPLHPSRERTTVTIPTPELAEIVRHWRDFLAGEG
jgi:hypothetical protein